MKLSTNHQNNETTKKNNNKKTDMPQGHVTADINKN